MQIVNLAQIKAVLDEQAAIAAIAEGFRLYSAGKVQLSAVGHLDFAAQDGDCHIKGGYIEGDDVFVVKLATGFYQNPQKGLPSANGFMAILSARTGAPIALLLDEGHLTNVRTAMAGAIAARAIMRADSKNLGVVGTGIQAELQARFIASYCGFDSIAIWGRSAEAREQLATALRADGLVARAADGLERLCEQSDLIVTTTPSRTPLVTETMTHAGMRIVAVGADAPGKCELDPALVTKADLIVADSKTQCIDHGEIAGAMASGLLDPEKIIELGALLAKGAHIFDPAATIIADLTGLGVQDVQIAKTVWEQLQNRLKRERPSP